jgi:hypothetical protein
MTHRSASGTSTIWLAVRSRIPQKIETWLARRNEAKATVKMRDRYLARSPKSIFKATKFIAVSP